MNTSEYQKLAERTECDQEQSRMRLGGFADQNNLPARVQGITLPARLNQAANGLASEAGEILGLIEKWIYFGQPLNYVKMVDELGDALWYVAQLCNALRIDMADVMQANIDKLRTRFPEKFDSLRAMEENRDRAAEEAVISETLNKMKDDLS